MGMSERWRVDSHLKYKALKAEPQGRKLVRQDHGAERTKPLVNQIDCRYSMGLFDACINRGSCNRLLWVDCILLLTCTANAVDLLLLKWRHGFSVL